MIIKQKIKYSETKIKATLEKSREDREEDRIMAVYLVSSISPKAFIEVSK